MDMFIRVHHDGDNLTVVALVGEVEIVGVLWRYTGDDVTARTHVLRNYRRHVCVNAEIVGRCTMSLVSQQTKTANDENLTYIAITHLLRTVQDGVQGEDIAGMVLS